MGWVEIRSRNGLIALVGGKREKGRGGEGKGKRERSRGKGKMKGKGTDQGIWDMGYGGLAGLVLPPGTHTHISITCTPLPPHVRDLPLPPLKNSDIQTFPRKAGSLGGLCNTYVISTRAHSPQNLKTINQLGLSTDRIAIAIAITTNSPDKFRR